MREGERGVLSIYFQKKIKHLKIKQDVMLLLVGEEILQVDRRYVGDGRLQLILVQ